MGSYATVAGVEARLAGMIGGLPFSPTTKPTLVQVERFINQYEGMIDGILTAQGYSTIPATGETDVDMLSRYVEGRVAAEAFGTAMVITNTEFPAAVRQWIADWDLFIRMLRDGELRLRDQSPASTEAGGIVMGSFTLSSYDYTDFELGLGS